METLDSRMRCSPHWITNKGKIIHQALHLTFPLCFLIRASSLPKQCQLPVCDEINCELDVNKFYAIYTIKYKKYVIKMSAFTVALSGVELGTNFVKYNSILLATPRRYCTFVHICK